MKNPKMLFCTNLLITAYMGTLSYFLFEEAFKLEFKQDSDTDMTKALKH